MKGEGLLKYLHAWFGEDFAFIRDQMISYEEIILNLPIVTDGFIAFGLTR